MRNQKNRKLEEVGNRIKQKIGKTKKLEKGGEKKEIKKIENQK